MNNDEILVVTGISEGEKARMTWLAKGLRQVDVASLAKVNVCDVTALEKGRYLKNTRRWRILTALGMLDDENGSV